MRISDIMALLGIGATIGIVAIKSFEIFCKSLGLL